MDRPDANPDVLRDDLKNLRMINRYFGGLSAVRKGVTDLLQRVHDPRPVQILDLATGSGDQPVALAKFFREHGRQAVITGVDKNPVMLSVARQRTEMFSEIVIREADITNLPFRDRSYDIVICSLALHHFAWDKAVGIVTAMKRLSSVGLIVNELSRSSIGACVAWLYTHLTTRNPMTLYDSYQSVLRSFTAEELAAIAREARLDGFTVQRRPMFRLLLVAPTDN